MRAVSWTGGPGFVRWPWLAVMPWDLRDEWVGVQVLAWRHALNLTAQTAAADTACVRLPAIPASFCLSALALSLLNDCQCVLKADYDMENDGQIRVHFVTPEGGMEQLRSELKKWERPPTDPTRAQLARFANLAKLWATNTPSRATHLNTELFEEKVIAKFQLEKLSVEDKYELRLELVPGEWSLYEYFILRHAATSAKSLVRRTTYVSWEADTVRIQFVNAKNNQAAEMIWPDVVAAWLSKTRAATHWYHTALPLLPPSVQKCPAMQHLFDFAGWGVVWFAACPNGANRATFTTKAPLRLLAGLMKICEDLRLIQLDWDERRDLFALRTEGQGIENISMKTLATGHTPTDARWRTERALQLLCSVKIHLAPIPAKLPRLREHFHVGRCLPTGPNIYLDLGEEAAPYGQYTLPELKAELDQQNLRAPSHFRNQNWSENLFKDRSLAKHVMFIAHQLSSAKGRQLTNDTESVMHLLVAFARATGIRKDDLARSVARGLKVLKRKPMEMRSLDDSVWLIKDSNPVYILAGMCKQIKSTSWRVRTLFCDDDGSCAFTVENLSKKNWSSVWHTHAHASHVQSALDRLLAAQFRRVPIINLMLLRADIQQAGRLPDQLLLCDLKEPNLLRMDPRDAMERLHSSLLSSPLATVIVENNQFSIDLNSCYYWDALLFQYLVDPCRGRVYRDGNQVWTIDESGPVVSVTLRRSDDEHPRAIQTTEKWLNLFLLDQWVDDLQPLDSSWYETVLDAFAFVCPALPADPVAKALVAGTCLTPATPPLTHAVTEQADGIRTISSPYPVTILTLLVLLSNEHPVLEISWRSKGQHWIEFDFVTELTTERLCRALDSLWQRVLNGVDLVIQEAAQFAVDIFYNSLRTDAAPPTFAGVPLAAL